MSKKSFIQHSSALSTEGGRQVKEFEYLAPESMQQALEWLNIHRGRARILAGGTDLYLRLRKGVFLPDYVIDLKRVPGLDYMTPNRGGGVQIGPTTLQDDVACSSLIQQLYPALAEAASWVGAVQTRNRATLVGNLCNASPAADTAPALLSYGAQVKLASVQGERTIALEFLWGLAERHCRTTNWWQSSSCPRPCRIPGQPSSAAHARRWISRWCAARPCCS